MIRDLIDGIKSKIPLCCIFYFIKNGFIHHKNTAYEVDRLRGNTFIMKESDPGYVPLHPNVPYVECDKCFALNRD